MAPYVSFKVISPDGAPVTVGVRAGKGAAPTVLHHLEPGHERDPAPGAADLLPPLNVNVANMTPQDPVMVESSHAALNSTQEPLRSLRLP